VNGPISSSGIYPGRTLKCGTAFPSGYFSLGHAMVQPGWGLSGGSPPAGGQAKGNIYFAHSDLSGFSIFEEAQYRGILAAEKVLARQGIPFSSSL